MPWIINHVPAKTGSGVSGEESEAAELLATYRPDHFVSGHDHAFPYASGQSWKQKLGESRFLVSGQLLSAPVPNYIRRTPNQESFHGTLPAIHGYPRTGFMIIWC
jgi:hypothetical protein